MGELISPIITECCKSCFCFDCLAVSLGELNTNKCLNCRQIITNSDIHVISEYKEDSKIITKKYDLKDKLDVLIDLVQNKPDGSFIVFANYVETFVKIEKKLKEFGISYHILKGQASVVKKNIDDFKEKKVKVLMLNAEYFGAGMNLQMTTDLVMFHRFRYEMEEQIIGRAQRLGRTTQLNVYYLLHDNESENIDYNFNFEDQGSIHYIDWLKNDKLNTNNIVLKDAFADNAEYDLLDAAERGEAGPGIKAGGSRKRRHSKKSHKTRRGRKTHHHSKKGGRHTRKSRKHGRK